MTRLNDLDASFQLVHEAINVREKYTKYVSMFGVVHPDVEDSDTLHDKCYGQNLLEVLDHCNLYSVYNLYSLESD